MFERLIGNQKESATPTNKNKVDDGGSSNELVAERVSNKSRVAIGGDG
jgi:hypothetical protein